MTRKDHRIFFTALGFLAAVQSNVREDKRSLQATMLAGLIESFCENAMPGAFANELPDIEPLLESYIKELRDTGSAKLNFDRQTLLRMYELLTVQNMRNEQKQFYISGHDDVIANRVLQLAEERIRREERA
jgi:hypothetical protein